MKKIYILVLSVLAMSCGGSDDGPGPDNGDGDGNPDAVPTAASLVFPEQNSICTEGKDFTDTTSTINFKWKAGENTTSYTLIITDIANSSAVKEFEVTSSAADVSLDVEMMRRGSQYLYKVVSSNASGKTAESAEWGFYNAGVPVESYAPFPAIAITPEREEALAATTTVILDWTASDLDGNDDIVEYDVYFGTTSSPGLLTTVTASMLADVTVASGNTYYWRIVTKDKSNNESGSATFKFSVN